MDPALLLRKYQFRFEVLDVILGGKSMIDSQEGLASFPTSSLEDAERFIRSYGYDLGDPIQSAEARGNIQEAVNFIRKYFLYPENPEGLKLEIPRKILEISDVRELFLLAAQLPAKGEVTASILRLWGCAVIKVVHTIAHVDKDLRTPYIADIQKQILDRFYKVIHRDNQGQLYLGERDDDPLRVNLEVFETKPKKSRESVLIKLLHKPENVAEDIFDQVGIRFVTQSRLDALRVVKFLKDAMVIMPANVKPSRSRNTLFDTAAFKESFASLLPKIEAGEFSEKELVEKLDAMTRKDSFSEGDGPDNQHTSKFYRAIQFTCRQLIRLRNPLYEDLKALKGVIRKKGADGEIAEAVDRIDVTYLQREIRFFYPYEVQIVDRLSADENERGRSAHSEYKKSQIQTALKRVMGGLQDASR